MQPFKVTSIVAIVFTIATASAAHAATWVSLGDSRGTTLDVDAESITRSGDTVKVWTRRTFDSPKADPRGEPYYSTKALNVVDCAARTTAVIQYSHFKDRDGSRTLHSSPNMERELVGRAVVPGSVMDTVMKFACSQSTNRSMPSLAGDGGFRDLLIEATRGEGRPTGYESNPDAIEEISAAAQETSAEIGASNARTLEELRAMPPATPKASYRILVNEGSRKIFAKGREFPLNADTIRAFAEMNEEDFPEMDRATIPRDYVRTSLSDIKSLARRLGAREMKLP